MPHRRDGDGRDEWRQMTVENEGLEGTLKFFSYAHLPEHLQEVSKLFHDLAQTIVKVAPRNPERTVALRKLLESKDAAVRAVL